MEVYVQQGAEAASRLAGRMVEGCVGVRVGRLHRLVGRAFERQLRPLGLTLPQLEILAALTRCGGPVKPTVVAELLGVERSTMSRNLAVLQERGRVTATDTSASGRALAVALTPAGTAVLAEAEQAWTRVQSALLDRLGPDAPGVLDRWLIALDAGSSGATRD